MAIRARRKEDFQNGESLVPLRPLNIGEIHDFDQMLEAMSYTSFGGRKLGEAAEVLTEMILDPDVFVVMSVSGAMTVAKMGTLICEMIDRGFVHALVTTGALISHGFVESSGMSHFKNDPKLSDATLYTLGYNRIFDTLEPEKNLDRATRIVLEVLSRLTILNRLTVASREINEELGLWLHCNCYGGFLKSAFLKNIPVYVPAFSDSEMGFNFALFDRTRREDQKRLTFDPFLDLWHYADLIRKQKKLGLFTIGGGVPRNWAQQVAPFWEYLANHAQTQQDRDLLRGVEDLKFTYGVRICPEPSEWGGLSGCTYSEGISWGKFIAPQDGGRQAEVLADATLVWPLLLKGVIQRLEKREKSIFQEG